MSEARVTIYRRSGRRIAEIRPELRSLAWKLNKASRARMRMPFSDDECTRENLRLGNYVLVESESGLPNWAGVIEPPLERDAYGVTINAYSGERLLKRRHSEADWHFQQMAPGAIFKQALIKASDVREMNLVQGNVYTGGQPQTQRWHYYALLRRVKELARLSGEDFHVGHRLSGGALQFLGHWYQQRGRNLTNSVLLAEGANVSDPSLSEQGPIANAIIVVGEGAEWGDRPIGTATDNDSISRHGYRQHVEQAPTEDRATLATMAGSLLDEMAKPREMVNLTVTDDEPGEFESYGVGDIVGTHIFVRGGEDWVFDDPVRVVARSWRPNGECELEVAAWDD